VRLPRMTTRRWMLVVATVAVPFTVMSRLHCDSSDHPYYWSNKAAMSRRMERWERQQEASARASAAECRRKARIADAEDRDRLESAARRYEQEMVLWAERADGDSQDAIQYFKMSRESGYSQSELPERIRREMKPEDLER
jgi:hypothetical protein